MKNIKEVLPGLLVSISIGLISIFLSRFVPKLGAATISIFLGMLIGNLFLNQDIFQKVKDLIKQGKAVSLYGLFVGLLQIVSAVSLIWILL